jgi:hypothetical protein
MLKPVGLPGASMPSDCRSVFVTWVNEEFPGWLDKNGQRQNGNPLPIAAEGMVRGFTTRAQECADLLAEGDTGKTESVTEMEIVQNFFDLDHM